MLSGSVIHDVYASRNPGVALGSLGIPVCPGTCEIEARDYGYPLPDGSERRQVLTLACGPLDADTSAIPQKA